MNPEFFILERFKAETGKRQAGKCNDDLVSL